MWAYKFNLNGPKTCFGSHATQYTPHPHLCKLYAHSFPTTTTLYTEDHVWSVNINAVILYKKTPVFVYYMLKSILLKSSSTLKTIKKWANLKKD